MSRMLGCQGLASSHIATMDSRPDSRHYCAHCGREIFITWTDFCDDCRDAVVAAEVPAHEARSAQWLAEERAYVPGCLGVTCQECPGIELGCDGPQPPLALDEWNLEKAGTFSPRCD